MDYWTTPQSTNPTIGLLNPRSQDWQWMKWALYNMIVKKENPSVTFDKYVTKKKYIKPDDFQYLSWMVHDMSMGSGGSEVKWAYTMLPPDVVEYWVNTHTTQQPQQQSQWWMSLWGQALAAWAWATAIQQLYKAWKPGVSALWPQLNEIQNLSNKLTQVGKVEDLDVTREWSQIISKLAKPGTKTYQDLYSQMSVIKNQYYNQLVDFNWKKMKFWDVLESIPVEDNSRSLQLLKSMQSDLVDAGWNVKLGQEKLYDDISHWISKFEAGEATLKDQTTLKTLINQYNKAWTAAGSEKSGITPEGLRNVYADIKTEIETTAKAAWFKNVAKINRGYWALLDTEPYIEKAANTALKASNVIKPTTTMEKIGNVIGRITDIPILKETKWVIAGIIKKVAWKTGQWKLTIEEIQKDIPKILSKLSETLPEIEQGGKEILGVAKKWASVLEYWNPEMDAAMLADYLESNPEISIKVTNFLNKFLPTTDEIGKFLWKK